MKTRADRDMRTYWLLSSRDCRIFVHDPLHDISDSGRRQVEGGSMIRVEGVEVEAMNGVERISGDASGDRAGVEGSGLRASQADGEYKTKPITDHGCDLKASGAEVTMQGAADRDHEKKMVVASSVALHGKSPDGTTGGGGKGDWRVWPGGPPGTGSGIVGFGGGLSEAWGFYDRADQVDSLLAYLNPQVW